MLEPLYTFRKGGCISHISTFALKNFFNDNLLLDISLSNFTSLAYTSIITDVFTSWSEVINMMKGFQMDESGKESLDTFDHHYTKQYLSRLGLDNVYRMDIYMR
jgi:hypothetical protein